MVSLDTEFTCDQESLKVWENSQALSISPTCFLRLNGRWQTATGDWLTCVGGNNDTAECGGLAALGLGFFQGNLKSTGDKVTLTGSFSMPGKPLKNVTGRLAFRDRHLSGRIEAAGAGVRTIELL